MNILEQIAERTRGRVAADQRAVSFAAMRRQAEALPTGTFPFEAALRTPDIAFICEVKKASPSKGVIAENFPFLDIARDYQAAGAAAISVLTEPFWFMGADSYLQEIAQTVRIPLLRKDFTVDPYMVYQAKALGAHAVLFICALLDTPTLTEYIHMAHSLGLSALVEVHDEAEAEMALQAGAGLVGVNNRNLKTFGVDISLSARLRPLFPPDVLFVAESGIQTPEDVAALRRINAHAALIGESFMRASDKPAAIGRLRGEV